MGIDNIITFDAHDPRVMNAIPLNGFENVMPSYQFIKGILKNVKDLTIDAEHLMIISPEVPPTVQFTLQTYLALIWVCFTRDVTSAVS